MRSVDSIKALNDISAYQRGMFTAAQAKRLGVERYTLVRLEKNGFIERVLRGIYRMGGAPSIREEDVYAAWLSLIPDREPGVPNTVDRTPIATGATAAWLQGIGEIGPTPLEFCCETRKQTQRGNLIIRKRKLGGEDVVFVGGIPVTSPSRTVLDLIDGGEDLSLVSNVLKDALDRSLILDEEKLASEINRKGPKVGIPKGASLYEFLTKGR